MVYDDTVTDIHEVCAAFNELATIIKFTIEKETNNIKFLDISISNKRDSLHGLSGKYPAIFNILRTGHVTLM
jgi:hypothetical protein